MSLMLLIMNDPPHSIGSVVYHNDLKFVRERKGGLSLSRHICCKCFQKQSPSGNAGFLWNGIESNPGSSRASARVFFGAFATHKVG